MLHFLLLSKKASWTLTLLLQVSITKKLWPFDSDSSVCFKQSGSISGSLVRCAEADLRWLGPVRVPDSWSYRGWNPGENWVGTSQNSFHTQRVVVSEFTGNESEFCRLVGEPEWLGINFVSFQTTYPYAILVVQKLWRPGSPGCYRDLSASALGY